jgi:hypothetical protein
MPSKYGLALGSIWRGSVNVPRLDVISLDKAPVKISKNRKFLVQLAHAFLPTARSLPIQTSPIIYVRTCSKPAKRAPCDCIHKQPNCWREYEACGNDSEPGGPLTRCQGNEGFSLSLLAAIDNLLLE